MVDLTELNKIIKESGLRKDYISKKLKVNPFTLRRILNGTRKITIEDMLILIDILHIQNPSKIFFYNQSEIKDNEN